jgi:hypothetical protein
MGDELETGREIPAHLGPQMRVGKGSDGDA